MDVVGKAKRVRIYVSEDDRVDGKPVDRAVLDLLRRENAQGATVLRGVEGLGASGRVHGGRLVDVAARLPLVIEWVDAPERVERLAPRLTALVRHGLITVDDTELLRFDPAPVRDLAPGLRVEEVMSRDVLAVDPTTPVREVVERLLGKSYRGVPVVEAGRPVGIVTSGDLVRRGGLGVRLELLARLDSPALRETLARLSHQDRTAREVMTPDPVTVPAGLSVPAAAEVMARRRLKRLPVVDADGRLVGMVSRLDLLRTVAGALRAEPDLRPAGLSGDLPLARVMRRDAPSVHPDTSLPEVFQAVTSTRLNCALVVDADRRPVGLVTDAELLERVTPALRPGALRALMERLPFVHRGAGAPDQAHLRGRTAGEVMRRRVATAGESTLLSEAIARMLEQGDKVLAVTDDTGRLVGLVDRADLLHGLVDEP